MNSLMNFARHSTASSFARWRDRLGTYLVYLRPPPSAPAGHTREALLSRFVALSHGDAGTDAGCPLAVAAVGLAREPALSARRRPENGCSLALAGLRAILGQRVVSGLASGNVLLALAAVTGDNMDRSTQVSRSWGRNAMCAAALCHS